MVDILLMNQNNHKILNTKCHLKCYHISVLLFVTRFSHFDMYIATFRLLTASLHQAMRSIGYAAPFISRWSAVIGTFRSSLFRREVAHPAVRCCTSPPVEFLDRRHPRFGNFNSAAPVDVIRVKSYVDSFLDPTGVPVTVSINKLSLVPKRIMAGLRDGGSLGTGESYIPVVLFDSLVHRSPCFPDVDFTAFTGNLVNQAILISRIDGVLRSHQM